MNSLAGAEVEQLEIVGILFILEVNEEKEAVQDRENVEQKNHSKVNSIGEPLQSQYLKEENQRNRYGERVFG